MPASDKRESHFSTQQTRFHMLRLRRAISLKLSSTQRGTLFQAMNPIAFLQAPPARAPSRPAGDIGRPCPGVNIRSPPLPAPPLEYMNRPFAAGPFSRLPRACKGARLLETSSPPAEGEGGRGRGRRRGRGKGWLMVLTRTRMMYGSRADAAGAGVRGGARS